MVLLLYVGPRIGIFLSGTVVLVRGSGCFCLSGTLCTVCWSADRNVFEWYCTVQ